MSKRQPDLKGEERRSAADVALREFLRQLLASMPFSRIQLAELLEKELGEVVSLARLDSFTAPTKQAARLPAYFLPAIAKVLNSDAILLHLARPCARKRFEFAEAVEQLRRIADELLAETRKGRAS